MKRKFKYSFKRVFFRNRWAEKKYYRNYDWTIIGVHIRFSSPTEFCYDICLFGFECDIWINKKQL